MSSCKTALKPGKNPFFSSGNIPKSKGVSFPCQARLYAAKELCAHKKYPLGLERQGSIF
jgi:hypothetical protein